MNTRHPVLAAFAATSLLLAPLAPAAAADGLALQLVSGLGQAIATQGNAAFQQIRADLQNDLINTVDAWLPRAAPIGHAHAAGASTGLSEMVEWHEQARQTASNGVIQ